MFAGVRFHGCQERSCDIIVMQGCGNNGFITQVQIHRTCVTSSPAWFLDVFGFEVQTSVQIASAPFQVGEGASEKATPPHGNQQYPRGVAESAPQWQEWYTAPQPAHRSQVPPPQNSSYHLIAPLISTVQ